MSFWPAFTRDKYCKWCGKKLLQLANTDFVGCPHCDAVCKNKLCAEVPCMLQRQPLVEGEIHEDNHPE